MYGRLTLVCGILLVAALAVGTSLPTASVSNGSVPREAAVNVTADDYASHTLDIAQAVYINDTSTMVNVTNRLGRDVTITVALRSDSTHLGDLIVDSTNYGDDVSFQLAKDATETVSIEIPDDSSLTDETVYFHANASAPGLTVKAPDRGVPVDA